MNGWQRLADRLMQLIERYDEGAIVLFVLVEEAGVPLPVPGDVAMVLAGYRVARGQVNPFWILALLILATFVGASLLYWLGARGGRPLLYRYGRYLHCDHAKLTRLERWLHQRGMLAILLGRLIPGLRIVTPLAAGAFGVPYRVFLPPLLVGSSLYILALVLLGMWAGPQAVALMEGLHLPLRAVLTVVTFVALGGALLLLYRRASRHGQLTTPLPTTRLRETAPPETAMLAGFLATIEMGLGVNLLLYGLSVVDLLRPEVALVGFLRLAADRLTAGSLPYLVLLLVLLILGVNIGTALLYARVGVPYLPGPPWFEGLLFAVVPFLLWSLVVLPLCGAGPFGLGLGAGWWPLTGEAVRHALFGVGLGLSHALLARARTRSMMPLPTTEKPLVSG